MTTNNTAAILTIVGGVFYIIGGAVVGLAVNSLGSFSSLSSLSGLEGAGSTAGLDAIGYAVAGFGILSGVLIIVGGLLFRSENPHRRKLGGILAVIMLLIGGLATVGGLIIGFILTAIGAYMGLTYKSSNPGVVLGMGPIGSISIGSGGSGAKPSAYGSPPTNYCIKCGSPLKPGAIFCGACGERI